MSNYVGLFSSILDSTIWQEEDYVRITWITMLAMANNDGVVEASIPGLAKRAGVSIEQCLEALDILKKPDKFSRTQDFQGRRIQDVQGGWFLLNSGKYRDMIALEERRANNRKRAKIYRERKKQLESKTGVTHQVYFKKTEEPTKGE